MSVGPLCEDGDNQAAAGRCHPHDLGAGLPEKQAGDVGPVLGGTGFRDQGRKLLEMGAAKARVSRVDGAIELVLDTPKVRKVGQWP